MNRRELLRYGSAALLSLAYAGRLYAAPLSGPRFLLVFLRGGYDSTNLLVPYSSSFYYEVRPNLAIAKPDAASNTSALALDADWALAPAVRDTIGTMYQQKEVAFIPFVGTEDLTRSHFETQDSIELGQPLGSSRDFRSGFMGRLSDVLNGANGAPSISFTDALPLAFEGAATVPNLSLKNVGKPPFDERQSRILSDMYSGHHLEGVVSNGLELRHEVAQEIADEMKAANRDAINTKGFELEAERMGMLMRDKYRIGFIDVGGWDTHVGEGAAQGTLPTNLSSLGRGLQTFSQTLGAEWKNTVVVVLSEFGRTFRENGNRGTDHGHGTVYWVLGGSINGGTIVGEQLAVNRQNLFQDRDYPVLNDYRAVLGGLFRSMWGLSAEQGACLRAEGARRLETHLGLTHIDTAEMYGDGAAERLIGKAIAGRRDEVFLVSKVLPSNASLRGTIKSCENSLRCLNVERLDCYLLHWRGRHPLSETIAAFERLKQQGKIGAWGVSNFDVADLDEIEAIAGVGHPACNQVLYHLEERAIEHAVIPWCERRGTAVVAYTPFGVNPRVFDGSTPRAQVLREIAAAQGATPHQVALQFLLRRRGTFVIPKAADGAHLAENAGALRFSLTESQQKQIETAFPLGSRPSTLPMI